MFDKKFVEELPRPQGLPCQNTKKFHKQMLLLTEARERKL